MEDKHDQRIEELTLRIVHEDMAILENLNPVRTPDTNNKEILLPSDHGAGPLSGALQGVGSRGWRIDMKALRARQGDVAFAIPCPARRESGNWVLDAVPLMPPTEQAHLATTHELRA